MAPDAPPPTSSAALRVPDTSIARFPRVWLIGIIVAVLTGAVFANTLANGFVYDDESVIVENPHYRGFDAENIAWMFTTFRMGHYQPLTWLSLALDHAVWGMDPRGYHLTNVILHALNALLVFLLALKILGLHAPSKAPPASAPGLPRLIVAALAALLFAVHPLRVESVAWVTERRDVLSSLWLLVTLHLYLRAVASRNRYVLWFVLAVLAFILSLLSRAMGVTLPAILLLLDAWPLRRIGPAAGGWFSAAARRACLEKIPLFLLAGGFAVLAPLAQGSAGAAVPLSEHGILARIAQACYGLVFYVYKTIVPTNLAPLYEMQFPLNIAAPQYVLAILLVVLVAAGLLALGRRMPAVTLTILIHAVLLAPVLGFFQSGRQEVADRYSYLPAIAWSILLAAGLDRWWRSESGRRFAPVAAGALALAVGGVALLTVQQDRVWQSELTLWSHAAEAAPGATAHQNLGAIYARQSRFTRAVENYHAALRYLPKHGPALLGLAKALNDANRHEEALQVWPQVVEALPDKREPRFEYATALQIAGRDDDAAAQYERLLELDPQSTGAWVNLAIIELKRGDADAADAALGRALAIKPDHAEALYVRANIQRERGQREAAVATYRAALAAQPDFPDAQTNLGITLAALGETGAAIEAYRAVLDQHPDHIVARYNLAAALAQLGDRTGAIRMLNIVLEQAPDNAPARRALDALTGAPPTEASE
jgi:tetratricopeptide (TPR) repeat protein